MKLAALTLAIFCIIATALAPPRVQYKQGENQSLLNQ